MSDYSANAQALRAFGEGVNVTAHNLANVNTGNFRAWSRVYGEGAEGSGPRVDVRVGGSSPQAQDELTLSPFLTSPSPDEIASAEAASAEAALADEGLRNNTVDVGREMTNLISDQRAFEANAATISTREDMDSALLGMVMDQRV